MCDEGDPAFSLTKPSQRKATTGRAGCIPKGHGDINLSEIIVSYNNFQATRLDSVRKKTAVEIIEHSGSHLDHIIEKHKDSELLITPVGTDCYSSFLAKSIENYFPSIFGFRNINPDFTSNYLNNASESSHFTLLKALNITKDSIGLVKHFELFGETNIHCLENPFGMFLLNHDGGFDTPRPYTEEILQKDVLSRLAHLDITTYAFLFSFENCKRKIIVFSGSEEKKAQVIKSFHQNASKLSSECHEILFLNLMPLLEGTDEPEVTCNENQINLQLFKAHADYGNVAANWNNIKEQLTKHAQDLIQSKSLPKIF